MTARAFLSFGCRHQLQRVRMPFSRIVVSLPCECCSGHRFTTRDDALEYMSRELDRGAQLEQHQRPNGAPDALGDGPGSLASVVSNPLADPTNTIELVLVLPSSPLAAA